MIGCDTHLFFPKEGNPLYPGQQASHKSGFWCAGGCFRRLNIFDANQKRLQDIELGGLVGWCKNVKLYITDVVVPGRPGTREWVASEDISKIDELKKLSLEFELSLAYKNRGQLVDKLAQEGVKLAESLGKIANAIKNADNTPTK